MLIGLAAAAFVAIFFFGVPFPLIVLGAGVDRLCRRPRSAWRRGQVAGDGASRPADAIGLADDCRSTPRPTVGRSLARLPRVWLALWLAPVAAASVPSSARATSSAEIAVFFSKMAVVTFGGAYAVLAYVAQQAVENYRLAPARARCWTASAWPRRRPGR